ncbi:PAS domain S-box protein [Methanococcoides methylutens]|uniref:PAS domain S-box protein n=1 Tax=Methanococcoides methylutens TaxID=2226 RepID=UPI00404479E2
MNSNSLGVDTIRDPNQFLLFNKHSIDHCKEFIFWIREDGSFLFINEAGCERLGYSLEELLSMSVYDIAHKLTEDVWKETWNEVKKNRSVTLEREFCTKDGQIFPAEIFISFMTFENLDYNFTFAHEITERKKAEKKLKEHAENLKRSNEVLKILANVINSSPVIVFLWKAEHNWPVEFVSDNISQFGYSAKDFMSEKLLYGDIIHPSDIDKVRNKYSEFSEDERKDFTQEYRILTKSGEIRWVEERTFIQHDEDGLITSIQGVIVDITESKQANKFLQIQCDLGNVLTFTTSLQDTYSQLLEMSLRISPFDSGCLYIVDRSTGDLNLAAHEGLSTEYIDLASYYSADSVFTRLLMIGNSVYKNHSEIGAMTATKFPPREKLRATALIPVKYQGQIIAALKLISHTKHDIPDDSRNSLETIASQIGIVIERVTSEEEFQNNYKDLQLLFDSLEDLLFIIDLEGCILHCNKASPKRLGYSVEELLDMNILSLTPHNRLLETAKIFSDIIEEKLSSFTIPLISRDKTPIPMETRFTKGKWKGKDVMIGLSRELATQK